MKSAAVGSSYWNPVHKFCESSDIHRARPVQSALDPNRCLLPHRGCQRCHSRHPSSCWKRLRQPFLAGLQNSFTSQNLHGSHHLSPAKLSQRIFKSLQRTCAGPGADIPQLDLRDKWMRRACLQDVLQLLEGIGQLLNRSGVTVMLHKAANLVFRLTGQKMTAFA